jgi:hypothetical protein
MTAIVLGPSLPSIIKLRFKARFKSLCNSLTFSPVLFSLRETVPRLKMILVPFDCEEGRREVVVVELFTQDTPETKLKPIVPLLQPGIVIIMGVVGNTVGGIVLVVVGGVTVVVVVLPPEVNPPPPDGVAATTALTV